MPTTRVGCCVIEMAATCSGYSDTDDQRIVKEIVTSKTEGYPTWPPADTRPDFQLRGPYVVLSIDRRQGPIPPDGRAGVTVTTLGNHPVDHTNPG